MHSPLKLTLRRTLSGNWGLFMWRVTHRLPIYTVTRYKCKCSKFCKCKCGKFGHYIPDPVKYVDASSWVAVYVHRDLEQVRRWAQQANAELVPPEYWTNTSEPTKDAQTPTYIRGAFGIGTTIKP